MGVREDAKRIWQAAISAVQPDSAVIRALKETTLTGKIKLVAAGKAAWQMAKAASNYLGERLEQGTLCAALRPGKGFLHYPFRYSGRPAGYDRLGADLP